MRRSIFAVTALLSLARPAWPAAYNPDPDIRALREENEAMMRAIDRLVSTALEPEKIPMLTGYVDEAMRRSAAAANEAKGIYDGTTPPSDQITIALKGRGNVAPVDRRQETLSLALVALRKRWDKARDQAQFQSPGSDGSQRAQTRREILDHVATLLEEADRLLKEAQPILAEMDDYRQKITEKARRARQARDELGTASDKLLRDADSFTQTGREARTRIEASSAEPQNENRGRANQKIRELIDAGRTSYYDADVAKHRAEDFSDNYRGFAKALAQFEDGESAVVKRTKDADKALTTAEELLQRLFQSQQ